MALHCNAISHWLGAYTEWSLKWASTTSCLDIWKHCHDQVWMQYIYIYGTETGRGNIKKNLLVFVSQWCIMILMLSCHYRLCYCKTVNFDSNSSHSFSYFKGDIQLNLWYKTYQIPKLKCFSSCSGLCPIHWSQVLCWKWRCSWSSAVRQCSNYIWVINNFIAYGGASYIRGFMVFSIYIFLWLFQLIVSQWHSILVQHWFR